DRIKYSKQYFKKKHFSRKEYLSLFKNISSATSSRDLREGVDMELLVKTGSGNQTKYFFK
ncbi:MAG: hypothetical protein KC478_11640, partial [Bacteriovoracaceae bacterium]|nr:hypothetical protein [Bacteriovoracaceae bacterium]